MKVTLMPIDKVEVVDKLYTACRTCYNPGKPEDMFKEIKAEEYQLTSDLISLALEKRIKLIKQVLNSGHLSVSEHTNFTFMISGVSRALTHQLVRHRHASYCVSGDTEVRTGRKKKIKISDLYNKTQQYKDLTKIRCIDENTREIYNDSIAEVVYSGKKEVYEVKTKLGYSIKSTLEHRYFTNDGWKRLNELSVGSTVYVNGIPAYQDKEWLNRQYNELKLSQEEIGEICGVSKHTVRKWVRKYNLQKEMGEWSRGVEPVNKGRTKHDYEPMARTSAKMMGNKNTPKLYGSDNKMYRGDNILISGGYYRSRHNFTKQGVCSNCGAAGETHIHHLDKNPKNYSKENMVELCQSCHKAIHFQEVLVVIPDTIISIERVGVEDTYDISMAGERHNFIANGFVVHNSQQSQRYCGLEDGAFEYVTPSAIEKNEEAKEVFEYCMQTISEAYRTLTELGIVAEDARAVLPNAACTSITMTLNLRELMHLCNERLCTCAQAEIRTMVRMMVKEVLKQLDFLTPYLVPKCEMLGYCNEPARRSCGRKKLRAEVLGDDKK